MQNRFGFLASDTLVNLVIETHTALENDASDMYVYRNRLIEQVSDELIQKMIMDIADRVSDPERKENIRSLGQNIKKYVGKVVSMMLSKDKNSIVLQSQPFLEESIARDADGNVRMGFGISKDFYNKAQKSFQDIADGNNNKEVMKQVKEVLKELDDQLLSHFLVDFVKTLGWGSIKLKAAQGTKIAISKLDSMMIDKMITKLTTEQLQELLPHFEALLFTTDIVGLDVLK